MRLTKMLGLAAVAAIAATAFVGASSAMANESTQLCREHEVPCEVGNQISTLTMLATNTLLLSPTVNVLCLHSKATAEIEGENLAKASEPLRVTVTELLWKECGTNGAHNNCTVTNLKLPLFDVLKTALNLGTAKVLGAEINIDCGILFKCTYSETTKPFELKGALHTEGTGHGMFTANNLEVAKGKGFLCPSTANWHALYEPLKHLYIVS